MGCVEFLIDEQVLSRHPTSLLLGEGEGKHRAGAQSWLAHRRDPAGHLLKLGSPSSWG